MREQVALRHGSTSITQSPTGWYYRAVIDTAAHRRHPPGTHAEGSPGTGLDGALEIQAHTDALGHGQAGGCFRLTHRL